MAVRTGRPLGTGVGFDVRGTKLRVRIEFDAKFALDEGFLQVGGGWISSNGGIRGWFTYY